jgi:hypothetical protein
MYATPSVLKRYASDIPAADFSDFFSGAIFSCAVGALERSKSAAQQVKTEHAKTTPAECR